MPGFLPPSFGAQGLGSGRSWPPRQRGLCAQPAPGRGAEPALPWNRPRPGNSALSGLKLESQTHSVQQHLTQHASENENGWQGPSASSPTAHFGLTSF